MTRTPFDETIDYIAIQRVHASYADIVTRRAWSELHNVMLPSCSLNLSLGDREFSVEGPAAIGAFIGEQLQQFSFFEFIILNSVIQIDDHGSRAGARMYMQEARQNVSDGRRTDAFGVYHDRLEKHDGKWWLAKRLYGSYSRTIAERPENEQVVFPLPEHDLGSL